MHRQLLTMLQLNMAELDLLMVQSWIDNARKAVPRNQVVQLELDRRQTELDVKLENIAMIRLVISSQN